MRIDADSFKEILDTLYRNKSRSILTGFGVFWGLFLLLVMIGGGSGLRSLIGREFTGFATNMVVMASDRTSKPYKGMKEGRYWELNLRDMERLRQRIPELDIITPVYSRWGIPANYGNRTYNCVLKGVNAEYTRVEEPEMKYGRFINEMDVRDERKVCVIGSQIYDQLFSEGGDPTGQKVEIGGIYYTVIGLNMSSGNVSIDGNASESAVIPASVARKLFNKGNEVELICATGKKGVKMSTLNKRIREALCPAHLVDPEDDQALFLLNAEELFSLMDNLFRGLNFLIWLVGVGTILAGVIGVSNIMMVTVKERTSEIGIRRAIGATPSDIIAQITLESIFLTIVSGMLGISLATLVLSGLDKAFPDMGFTVSFQMAVWSALMLAVLGVAASLAPVSRAMSIKPVDAMREE